jgi:hypothetical protein
MDARTTKAKKKSSAPFRHQNWPADKVERRSVAELEHYARNPRLHSDAQVRQIAKSIQEFGWTVAVLVDENGLLIAGHGRVLAAKYLGLKMVPVVVAEGWTEQQKTAYRIADNQLTLLGEWDTNLLTSELIQLKTYDYDLRLTGFAEADLVTFLATPSSESESMEPDRATLLKLVNVTIAEPKHEVIAGDHYVLSKRHHLICAGVIAHWQKWKDLLIDGTLFCPYAGIFIPFSDRARDHVLVMVQPDKYIAGHILDRYEEIHGKKSIEQIASH